MAGPGLPPVGTIDCYQNRARTSNYSTEPSNQQFPIPNNFTDNARPGTILIDLGGFLRSLTKVVAICNWNTYAANIFALFYSFFFTSILLLPSSSLENSL
ncbi:hypothetical protein TNCV_2451031 [Trichonephila clavipes]|nr:hypothetical protein TNCV_2451031 [Trichonephila clavipes]